MASPTHHRCVMLTSLHDQLPTENAAIGTKEPVSTSDIDEEGETTMGMLRLISCRGDDRLLWNEQEAQAGDAEALAALQEVERIFVRERARGATAFRVEAGQPVERLEQFDAQAHQIILVPRVVGG